MEHANPSTHRAFVLGTTLLLLLLPACSSAVVDDPDVGASAAALTGASPIPFSPLQDPLGISPPSQGETRRLVVTNAQYGRLFGHDAPAEVDFAEGDAVVFYSPGVQRTGGYVASIAGIDAHGRRLVITTSLSSPGEQCPVTQALTHPYALVKFRRPGRLRAVKFRRKNEVRDCTPAPSCDDQTCPDGEHCELEEVVCITTPCLPVPTCVPDAPKQFCGGIAGIPCPGFGKCVDDPSDDCDPQDGGADCGGMCSCIENVLCVRGKVFDSSPDVCDCVPDPTQDPCAGVRCRAGTHCEAPDGAAACVPDAPFCGGIAGLPCPGAGTCVDNPDDDCDPKQGGADCGGSCVCAALGLCKQGMVWDDSPDVCGCVPQVNPCASTLCQKGTRCEVQDGQPVCVSDGTLACGKATCADGTQCCNASCGICTPPGTFCIQIACVDEQ